MEHVQARDPPRWSEALSLNLREQLSMQLRQASSTPATPSFRNHPACAPLGLKSPRWPGPEYSERPCRRLNSNTIPWHSCAARLWSCACQHHHPLDLQPTVLSYGKPHKTECSYRRSSTASLHDFFDSHTWANQASIPQPAFGGQYKGRW